MIKKHLKLTNTSSIIVEDNLPFPGSEIYYYSYLYLNEKEFFQVHVFSIFTPKKLFCFFSFENLLKKRNKNPTEFNLVRLGFAKLRFAVAYGKLGLMVLFGPSLKSDVTPLQAPKEAVVSSNQSLSCGFQGRRIGQPRKPSLGISSVVCQSLSNECPGSIAEVLTRFGLDSEQVWAEMQQSPNLCLNPEKRLKQPPDYLSGFLKEKGMDKSTFSVENLQQGFVDELSSYISEKLTTRYPRGFGAAGPVFDSTKTVVQTSEQRKQYQVKANLIYTLINENEPSPIIEQAYQDLGEAMHRVSKGEITQEQFKAANDSFKNQIDLLTPENTPLLKLLGAEHKQFFAYLSYLKRCVAGSIPPTLLPGQFYQNQDAHFVGRDPGYGLDITANQGTISDQQHSVATQIERELDLPGARDDGGVVLLTTAQGRDKPLQVALAGHIEVVLGRANTNFVQQVLQKSRQTDLFSVGGAFARQGYLNLLFDHPATDPHVVQSNKKAILEIAESVGSFYGGPFGVLMGTAAKPNSTALEINTYYKMGAYLGKRVFPQALAKSYTERITKQVVQENAQIRHISQIPIDQQNFS